MAQESTSSFFNLRPNSQSSTGTAHIESSFVLCEGERFFEKLPILTRFSRRSSACVGLFHLFVISLSLPDVFLYLDITIFKSLTSGFRLHSIIVHTVTMFFLLYLYILPSSPFCFYIHFDSLHFVRIAGSGDLQFLMFIN